MCRRLREVMWNRLIIAIIIMNVLFWKGQSKDEKQDEVEAE